MSFQATTMTLQATALNPTDPDQGHVLLTALHHSFECEYVWDTLSLVLRSYFNASVCVCVCVFVIQTAIWSPKGPSQSHSNSIHLLPGNCISNELRVLRFRWRGCG